MNAALAVSSLPFVQGLFQGLQKTGGIETAFSIFAGFRVRLKRKESMSKEGDGKVENLRKSFGEKMLAKKLGLPVWVWALDLIVLIAFTKWTGFVITIQVACLLASFIYKKLGERKTKRPVVARALMTVIFMLIPGFFLSAMLSVFFDFATKAPEEIAEQIKERRCIEFLGVEIGSSIDSGKYKDYPRQCVSKINERYYLVRIPLGRKLLPFEGFDMVNVFASAKSHIIYNVELKCDHAIGNFSEYRLALEQMMRTKYGVRPEKSESNNSVSFELKGACVCFRTGGHYFYSGGKVYETEPYTTTLSCYKSDLEKLAQKEGKEVQADEENKRAKKEAERANKTAKAGIDLL